MSTMILRSENLGQTVDSIYTARQSQETIEQDAVHERIHALSDMISNGAQVNAVRALFDSIKEDVRFEDGKTSFNKRALLGADNLAEIEYGRRVWRNAAPGNPTSELTEEGVL